MSNQRSNVSEIRIHVETWKIHFTLGVLLLALSAALIYLAATASPLLAILLFFTVGWTGYELNKGWNS